MWPIIFVLALRPGWKRSDGDRLLWPIGWGNRICPPGLHTTVALFICKTSKQKPFVVMSEHIYSDTVGAPYAGKGTEKICVPTREVPPQPKVPLDIAHEHQRPRPHSEIAALQDLFDIKGGATADQWVDRIYRALTAGQNAFTGVEKDTITEFHVMLFNSRKPPCKETGSVGYATLKHRRCCSEFLKKVADDVNERTSVKFSITVLHVREGKERRVVYGVQGTSMAVDKLVEHKRLNGHRALTSSRPRRRHPRHGDESGLDLEAELTAAIWQLLLAILFDL